MNNLLTRSLTGILFVAILVGAICFSPTSFIALFALITGLTMWEFSTLVNDHAGAQVNRLINSVAGVYLFVCIAGYCADLVPPKAFIPYLVTLVYLPVSELYLRHRDPLTNWGYAFASQLYVALNLSMLSVLAFQYDPMSNQTVFQPALPLALFVFLWTNDTGAYCGGSLLHRRFPAKLFERVSPKKSWVGSLSGGLLCLLAGYLFSLFCPGLLSLPQWLGMALVVCVFGTWGDLVESLLKRQLGVKDSGTLLPGHGGMLDRFDSSLLAIPAVVIYLYTIQAF